MEEARCDRKLAEPINCKSHIRSFALPRENALISHSHSHSHSHFPFPISHFPFPVTRHLPAIFEAPVASYFNLGSKSAEKRILHS